MEQQLQNKLDFIREYLSTYFDKMLLKDIVIFKERKLPFTLPYIILINAGMDFLGGLQEGFHKVDNRKKSKHNSAERSCHFIKNWMGRFNELYKFEGMAEFIYNSVRSGAFHQAIFKKSVESYAGDDFSEKHLWVRINPGSEERIFIHALKYADDFLKAQEIFRKEYIVEKNSHDIYERLCELQRENIKQLPDLIKNLKDSGYKFEQEVSPSPSPAPAGSN